MGSTWSGNVGGGPIIGPRVRAAKVSVGRENHPLTGREPRDESHRTPSLRLDNAPRKRFCSTAMQQAGPRCSQGRPSRSCKCRPSHAETPEATRTAPWLLRVVPVICSLARGHLRHLLDARFTRQLAGQLANWQTFGLTLLLLFCMNRRLHGRIT